MTRRLRPLDANGWRIPRPETVAWDIYILWHLGLRSRDIANAIDRSPTYVAVVINRLANAEVHNARSTCGGSLHVLGEDRLLSVTDGVGLE